MEQSKTSGKLSTFTISSRGTVILTTGPGNVDRNDIYELERNLSYYIGRDGIKDIKLNERSNRLEISISVYNTEWIYLTYAQQTNILKNIYKDILYYNSYYTYNDISGEVLDYTYNNYPLNTFYYDSIGNVTLK